MIRQVISIILIMLFFGISFAFLFDKLQVEPVSLKRNYLGTEGLDFVSYGAVGVFGDNLRFNHNLISYYISDDCGSEKRENMVAAFNIFSEEVGIISFYEDGKSSDIKVSCSSDFVDLGGNLFAAGEGGPSRIINTSGFKVIEEGKILLYNSEECSYPVVELHELCHVFGFDHSPDPRNIMYNTSSCGQRMSKDMIELMRELYSVEALPDLKIGEASGQIHGRYLDFNISVLNEGLVDAENVSMAVLADGRKVDVVDFGKIEIGYGRVIRLENMLIGFGVEEVRFVVDYDEVVREISEENNAVSLTA